MEGILFFQSFVNDFLPRETIRTKNLSQNMAKNGVPNQISSALLKKFGLKYKHQNK